MDFSTVANLISNLGVPIALLFASFWLLDQERKDHKKEVDDLRQEFSDDRIQMIEALNNNTSAIQHLSDVMAGGDRNARTLDARS